MQYFKIKSLKNILGLTLENGSLTAKNAKLEEIPSDRLGDYTGDIGILTSDNCVACTHLEEGLLHGQFIVFMTTETGKLGRVLQKGQFEYGLAEGDWKLTRPIPHVGWYESIYDLTGYEIWATLFCKYSKGKMISCRPDMEIDTSKEKGEGGLHYQIDFDNVYRWQLAIPEPTRTIFKRKVRQNRTQNTRV